MGEVGQGYFNFKLNDEQLSNYILYSYSFRCELVHDLPLDDTCVYIKVRRIEEGICGAEKYTQDRLPISSLLVELHTHTPRVSDSVIQRGTGGGKEGE